MKKLVYVSVLLSLMFTVTQAQECKVYIPGQVGTQVELTTYDKKDKPKGIIKQTLKDISKSGDTTIYTLHQQSSDEKGKNLIEGDYRFKCLGEIFYIDMNTFMDKKTMDSYKDMQMKLTTDNVNIPAALTAGQKLKDGFIKMEVMAGPMPMTFKVDVVNRKVEKFEDITTPAGTFPCVLITEDIMSQMSFAKFSFHVKSWYSDKVGVVRSESYKQDKMETYMVLTSLKK